MPAQIIFVTLQKMDEREEIVSVIEYLVLLKNGPLLESPDDYIITYDAAKNPVARFGYYDLLRLNKKYHFTSPEIYDIISSSPAHRFAKGSREYRYAQHLYHITRTLSNSRWFLSIITTRADTNSFHDFRSDVTICSVKYVFIMREERI